MTETIQRKDIVVAERLRKDYGDVSELADSLEHYGTIQPLVFNKTPEGLMELVAGGRRLAACDLLDVELYHHGVTSVPGVMGFVYATELSEDLRRELELEENLQRKDMSWQEKVLSITEIHNLKWRRAAKDRETWGQRETGQLLGCHYSYVAYALAIAKELKSGSSITDCIGVLDAIRWLAQKRQDQAAAETARLSAQQRPIEGSAAPVPSVTVESAEQPDGEELVVPLSKMFFNSDMVTWGADKAEVVDYIFSDWPYAIDMAYLDQGKGIDVSRVSDTHNVTENLGQYPIWLATMYRLLKPNSFCILWYDNVHWQVIRTLAETVGFRVQRWPLVWVKTHTCLNQMASKNVTKATEFAIVLSKGNATLPRPAAKNYWIGSRDPSSSNPFAKPFGLWKWQYEMFCSPGQSTADFFLGEGSSIPPAIEFGLRPLGVEIDPNHFNQALHNIRETYTRLTKGKVKFE